MTADGLHLVKAIHNFKGTNNDELCFNKGDLITVTQMVDGGWWEGTLNDVTGWFPSNYVKECKSLDAELSKSGKLPVLSKQDAVIVPRLPESSTGYKCVVFKDILDTEIHHVQELQTLFDTILNPLKQSNILTETDYSTLVANFEEISDCQKQLLSMLETIKEQPIKDQKIGGAFMQVAPLMKKSHLTYYANHPKAVTVIERHKDLLVKFVDERTSATTGVLPLTMGLSAPFRRLEKYPALLQELQRHTDESHIDRGDTQRAAFVYKDISMSCLNIRRQKELELEVMTGTIRGWEGEEVSVLGDIVHMGGVVIMKEDKEKKDRHLVLFPGTLVILSVSSRMSAFIYEGKLPTSGVNVTRLEPCDSYAHAFEISGAMIQRFIVICQKKEDLDSWMPVLQQQIHFKRSGTQSLTVSDSAHMMQLHITGNEPPPPPHSTSSCTSQLFTSRDVRHEENLRVPPRTTSKVWTMWSLRPHPPLRSSITQGRKEEIVLRKSANKKRDKFVNDKSYEDDMKILQVIEAYCNSTKTRYTVNSALLDTPQVLIAEDEKIIIEETKGNMTIVQEKSLVDTVYALKDQLKDLKKEINGLARGLDDEKKARRKLEELVKRHFTSAHSSPLSGILED